MIIQIKDLVFQYERESGEVENTLDGISLNIEKGNFVAIIGKNGSGKSTLAKNINALLLPSSGVVYVNGYDTKNQDFLWDIRQTAGMVFQNPDNQLVSAIVEDDVAFGPENVGLPPEEIRERVDEALASVDMYESRKKAPHLLSGGQKQRIAIAGVIAMKPECIIMDEPTAMLDPKGRKAVIAIARKLNREGITIILITHFMDEAVHADRVIIIDEGRVLLDDTPLAVFAHHDEIKAANLEVPFIVELAQRLRTRGIPVPSDIIVEEDFVKWALS